ncbi:hypothetical protein [Bradyrhizobium sp. 164]|uniref:hypothetical protein n=1 Tax=Bradyrhizobium sp. 164 TaxID=2782637 RepID=UPI001FF8E307|nr:hypothetical protein [Bradyrhizobium sp. 164]MCK1595649.1 hypothetical protein [Bradyrhizobium sp. 164]
MTAISAFKSSDSIHVFSDGAWHDPMSAKLCGVGTKVHTIPEHNAIFAVTGMSTVPHLLSGLLMENHFADYRSLADAMPDLVKACSTRAKAVGLNMTGRCDVVLAGWSENVGPSIFVTECHFDHGFFKGAAVELYIRPSVDGSSGMHFPDDGLRLLEKQHAARFNRAAEGTFGSATVGGLVGGFAQHTQIDADGIQIKVLKRWPDEIK